MSDKHDFSTERREFAHGHLSRADLADTPIAQLERWLAAARDAGLKDTTAMTLANAQIGTSINI